MRDRERMRTRGSLPLVVSRVREMWMLRRGRGARRGAGERERERPACVSRASERLLEADGERLADALAEAREDEVAARVDDVRELPALLDRLYLAL